MSLINTVIVKTLPLVPKPIVGYFSAPYIAGDRLEDAVRVAHKLNSMGACTTLDVLGEHITRKEEATAYADQYIELLDTIKNEKLDGNVSLKPTQMGLKLDKQFCLETIQRVATKARDLGNFVRIDMEDYTCTDDTIWLYQKLKPDFPVGLVIQAYLRRTDSDLNTLIPLNANLRLCKGIYVESHAIAYKERQIVQENYLHLLSRLLENGCYVGIATHDEYLVWGALSLIQKLNVPKDRYEFQMLLGVTEALRGILIKDGHKLRVYTPFGKAWYAYSTRRLKENPAMAGYVLENILKRPSRL
jgi:proline dehydrogenase